MEDVHVTANAAPHTYATFWRRFSAFIIDNTLIHLILLPFFFIYLKKSGFWDLMLAAKAARDAGFQIGDSSMSIAILFGSFFNGLVILVLSRSLFDMLYHGIWEASRFQATPGKMAVNIKVVDENGNRLTIVRAMARNFLKILSNVTLLIGYVMALITEKHQALHDKLSSCYVLQTSYEVPHMQGVEYAGFWRRAVALIMDYFLISLLISPLKFFLLTGSQTVWDIALHNLQHPENQLIPPIDEIMRESWIGIITTFLTFFYFASFESSRFQASPGKIAIGIRVTDTLGQRLSFWHAAGRYIAKYVSGITLGIGYIMAGFTPKAQALHDELADTLVIKSQVPRS
jgi:uncharacterized RDD family membrane protein YckC